MKNLTRISLVIMSMLISASCMMAMERVNPEEFLKEYESALSTHAAGALDKNNRITFYNHGIYILEHSSIKDTPRCKAVVERAQLLLNEQEKFTDSKISDDISVCLRRAENPHHEHPLRYKLMNLIKAENEYKKKNKYDADYHQRIMALRKFFNLPTFSVSADSESDDQAQSTGVNRGSASNPRLDYYAGLNLVKSESTSVYCPRSPWLNWKMAVVAAVAALGAWWYFKK